LSFFHAAAGQTFTVAAETIAGLREYARLSDTSVWLRIPTSVRPGVGARVGVHIDVTELGRSLEVVAEVRREDPVGVRAVVVHAALADMIVLNHCLGGAASHPIAAQAQAPTTSETGTIPPLPADEHVWGDDEENIQDLIVSDQAAIVSPRVVGIDLGTSNSCVALTDDKGETHIFKDPNGRSSLPSVVSYMSSGQTLLGFAAIEQLVNEPERTIFGSKRFIGRPFSSEHVQRIMHKFPYKLAPDESHYAGILIDSRVRSPIDVSTRLLRELKDWAERAEGREVVRAVVTVPAYYNDNQRHAVKRAGGRAGLNVERIIDEPTAAAIAFGVAENTADMRVLVYDLGGGTFDVSILHIRGSEFKVLATSGDNFLGGEDFDNAIVDYMIKTYEEGYGHNIWSSHPGIRARMRQEAERAKHELSAVDQATINVENVPLTTQGTTNVHVNLTRTRLEQLVSRLVDRTLFYCEAGRR
jgi:actin-like ATPase involved in cell morphogenesis